ncbi:MAG: ethylbenzene dehydrogenase-related protein, partial [Betaproteobacteria bacterium]
MQPTIPGIIGHRRSRTAIARTLSVCLSLVALASCAKKAPVATEVVAARAAALPTEPDAATWREVPVFTAALVLQDLVEPRLMTPSTPAVQVQALTDGARIAFRLTWTDSTLNDLPGAARFSDACAVQLPAAAGPNLPAPQMGELNGRVEITYWSAAWQAEVNGRADSIQALYPNASVDHYPFDAAALQQGSPAQEEMEKRYAPARAAGHSTHPAGRPVQDLQAEGPGTLTPAPETLSDGRGVRVQTTWQVVIVRPLPEPL